MDEDSALLQALLSGGGGGVAKSAPKMTSPSISAFSPNNLEATYASGAATNPFAKLGEVTSRIGRMGDSQQYINELTKSNEMTGALSQLLGGQQQGADIFKTLLQYGPKNLAATPDLAQRTLGLSPSDLAMMNAGQAMSLMKTGGEGADPAARAGIDFYAPLSQVLGSVGLQQPERMTPTSIAANAALAGKTTEEFVDSTGKRTQVQMPGISGQADIDLGMEARRVAGGAIGDMQRLQTPADASAIGFARKNAKEGNTILSVTTDREKGVHYVDLYDPKNNMVATYEFSSRGAPRVVQAGKYTGERPQGIEIR